MKVLLAAFYHLSLALAEVANQKDHISNLFSPLTKDENWDLSHMTSAMADVEMFLLNSVPVQILVPGYSTLIPAMCQSILECLKAEGGRDYWQRVLTLGLAWARFGMVQAALLAPQGPVDPVHKLTIKMAHIEREVSTL